MRRLAVLAILVLLIAVLASGAMHTIYASGQPNQSCQAEPSTPGNSSSAPGSAFNDSGVAGTKYAGTQPQNSNNPKAVSQYDVACYQVSSH